MSSSCPLLVLINCFLSRSRRPKLLSRRRSRNQQQQQQLLLSLNTVPRTGRNVLMLLLLASLTASCGAQSQRQETENPSPIHHPSHPLHPMQRQRRRQHHQGTSDAPWARTDEDASSSSSRLDARALQESSNHVAGRLRSDLLSGYDRGAYPWEYAWTEGDWNASSSSSSETTATIRSGNRTGLSVEVGINFHRVFSVDIKSSVADLIVWFRQRWVDPRLAWNPEDYGGLKNIWFWIGDGVGSGETSEIWTPDIKLWNMETSLRDTLTDSYATVDSTGTVFWSRPGHLRPACKFEGLDSFPFDELSCTMEFGSWSYSGLYIRPVKMGEGYSVGGSETAGEAFAEYRLAQDGGVQCREHVYPPYPSLPEEDWPVLFYDVTFHRSWQPYMRGYILMQVILNFAGFGSFWLPVPSGERMGLVITAMLAAVASELVVAANLPSTAEVTWFQSFSLFSLSFAALALFESIAVIFFYYHRGKDLVPRWFRWIQDLISKCLKRIQDSNKGTGGRATNETEYDNSDSVLDKDTNRPSPAEEDVNDNSSEDQGSAVFVGLPESEPLRNIKGDNNDAADPRPLSQLRGSLVLNNRAHDADDFRDQEQAENNKRWQEVSKGIDSASRVVVPVAYAVVFTVLLNRAEYY